MGILDSFRKKKVDNDPDRHYADSLDYFKELEQEEKLDCPECAKAQKHVMLERTDGEGVECPECHYTLRRGRRV